ncbi:MAG: hypothetical protein KGI94_13340 [Paracoccaceae bacterium]|nr:hypothetical protein [Paracoccaceae bacterium]
MKILLGTAVVLAIAASGAWATTTSSAGATVSGSSTGIGNNNTTVYTGPNMTGSTDSAVNSVSIVQAGMVNGAFVAQAGNTATVNAPGNGSFINIQSPVVSLTGGGSINMSGMFSLLNSTNSIGDASN